RGHVPAGRRVDRRHPRGVLGGAALAHPERLGLDAVFPAFYLVLLASEVRRPRALAAAGLGVAITLAAMPVLPPGLPVLAARLAGVAVAVAALALRLPLAVVVVGAAVATAVARAIV